MTSIHPDQDRFLSPRECARIQSFPDRFLFQGSTIENYTLVCNAVPPLLARAIALQLRAQLTTRGRVHRAGGGELTSATSRAEQGA